MTMMVKSTIDNTHRYLRSKIMPIRSVSPYSDKAIMDKNATKLALDIAYDLVKVGFRSLRASRNSKNFQYIIISPNGRDYSIYEKETQK